MTVAEQFIRTGASKYVLVIGAELLSRYLDYHDRATCVIFGDGVAAAVFGAVEPPSGILAHELHTKASTRITSSYLLRHRHACVLPYVEDGSHYIKMRGNELFKVAVRSLEDVSRQVLKNAGLTTDDIDIFIPHQANQRITEAVRERLGLSSEKVYSNISALETLLRVNSICLDECVQNGRLKKVTSC